MQNTIEKLLKLPRDLRDFSHHTVFGTTAPLTIPNIDFTVSPIPPIMLDQMDLDFCTGEASSSINTSAQFLDYSLVDYLYSKGMPATSYDRAVLAYKYGLVASAQIYMNMVAAKTNGSVNLQLLALLISDKGDDFDPLYQFAKIKQVRGEWKGYGANLRDACNALVKFGSLPRRLSPFTYNANKPSDKTRNFLANWTNWSPTLDLVARKSAIGSFFAVDGPYDAFDNIRSALWQNYKGQGFEVMFGLNWREEWTYVLNAIINENYSVSAGDPHDIKLIGQKVIGGVPYIVLQNSWGKNVGDKGLYYLSRQVVNLEAASGFGYFTFKRLPKIAAAHMAQNGISVNDNWIVASIKPLLTLLSSIFKK